MRALKHVGRTSTKVHFVLNVCDVRGISDSVSVIAVCWERGGKMYTTRSVRVEGDGDERMAKIDSKLRLTATMFHSSRKRGYEVKLSTLRVLDRSPGGVGNVVGQAELDLASAISNEVEPHPQVRQLLLSPPGRPSSSGARRTMLQLSISSQQVETSEGSAADADDLASEYDAASEAGGSLRYEGGCSNSALPREPVSTLDDYSDNSARSGAFKRWGGGTAHGKGGNGPIPRDVPQMLTEAQAETRHAESRTATLQHRLRTEVLSGIEDVVERASRIRSKGELSELYHRQLMLIMDQVERIAYDEGGAVGGLGGVTALEAEVLQLRRDLAAAKVDVARMAGERDELMHVARRLNKQLADEAHHARGR